MDPYEARAIFGPCYSPHWPARGADGFRLPIKICPGFFTTLQTSGWVKRDELRDRKHGVYVVGPYDGEASWKNF